MVYVTAPAIGPIETPFIINESLIVITPFSVDNIIICKYFFAIKNKKGKF